MSGGTRRPRVLLATMGTPQKSSFVARFAWVKSHPLCEFEITDEIGWPFNASSVDRERIFRKLTQATARADVVILHRVLLERRFRDEFFSSRTPVIFDFDDALYAVPSGSYRLEVKTWPGWVKRAWRVITRGRPDYAGRFWPLVSMLKQVAGVSAGSPHLGHFASRYCSRIAIVPTVVDVEKFKVKHHSDSQPVTIGWYGSPDNHFYLHNLRRVFSALQQKFGERVRFAIISSEKYCFPDVAVEWLPWDAGRELEDLMHFDIGIMPLTEDEWARGKCANKAIYYMAAGIPPVVSPVGVNADLVNHCRNGFLATTDQEWIDSLSRLIESAKLRQMMGATARGLVSERFSRRTAANKLSEFIANIAHLS